MYADIIIDISYDKLDRTFQYIIPAALERTLTVGMLVNVPFGNGSALRKGCVVDITDTPAPELEAGRLKEIASIDTTKLPVESRLIQLAAWMKHNYGGTTVQALKTVLPVKEKVQPSLKRTVCLNISRDEAERYLCSIESKKNQAARVRLLRALLEDDSIDYSLVTGKLSVSAQTVKALVQKQIIVVEEKMYYRNPVRSIESEDVKNSLNREQKLAVDTFCADFDEGRTGTYYVHGITGSGKTEVYLHMIAHVIARGRQVIMLIPEIALTYQTVVRFYRRFGDAVSILNSRMSKGERYDQYLRAKEGMLSIMIGPRSALFTPFANLGLIVMDEEHEGAYKSETVPKYHARETAIEIAKRSGASVVLGSATPSVNAYRKCMSGEYTLFRLPNRAAHAQLPKVYVEDLREELKSGNRSMFSRRLLTLMADRLEKGEQTMLFLNKRGYAGFVSCRMCGHVLKCPHCDVSLTQHFSGGYRTGGAGKMVCHYCGYEMPAVKVCPECGSRYISGFKAGTEQVEEKVSEIFPDARVLRMDMDTTKGKEGHAKILEKFVNHEADILIGTQMIVKGHDFPEVTLMGVLAADMSLYGADYTASERTFQLLVQAAGRAGRSGKPGEVVIQTYSPNHFAVVAAAKQDYAAFYNEEILYRSLQNYPPVCNMLLLLFSSRDEAALERAVKLLPDAPKAAQVIGPANAKIYKINDVYTKVLYVKMTEYAVLADYAQIVEEFARNSQDFRKISVQSDFNPI